MLMAGTRWLALSCAGVRWRAPSCGVGHSPCPGVRWCEVLRRCCYGAVQWLREAHILKGAAHEGACGGNG